MLKLDVEPYQSEIYLNVAKRREEKYVIGVFTTELVLNQALSTCNNLI